MNYQNNTKRLIQSYESAVAWGNGDHEEALQEAVKAAFPCIGDDGQAELYAQIAEAWEGYRTALVPRKLWIGQIVTAFMSERAGSSMSGLKVHTNVRTRFIPCVKCEGGCEDKQVCKIQDEAGRVPA